MDNHKDYAGRDNYTHYSRKCHACKKYKPLTYYCINCATRLFCEACSRHDLHHDIPCYKCGCDTHEHWTQ